MTKNTLTLTLNPGQRSQLLAHLFTYLYSLISQPNASRPRYALDLLQEIATRLFRWSGYPQEELSFSFTLEEAQAIKEALAQVQPYYEQWPDVEESTMALRHLVACRLLLQEAEQRANTQPAAQDDPQIPEPGAAAFPSASQEPAEQDDRCFTLYLLCHPRNVSRLVQEFEWQSKQTGDAFLVSWSGHSRVLHQGVIALQGKGRLSPALLHNFDLDVQILDYFVSSSGTEARR